MIRLQIHPELWSSAEFASEQPGRLRRHPPLAADKFVDTLNWNPQVLGNGNLSQAERLEELLVQNLAWMGWCCFQGSITTP